ncbi:hypothetical protein [Bradyrhizobium sp. USDA 3458]|uniref:hypothetical protein n=1 Tax=Bradyrhizobium sp. USDA 3458 TaxID=2591461 RepID=UPI00114313D9|nr:hypothetical protein [Bradyrhizobium sp. USDA 3458]
MADYSKLSDAELMALVEPKAAAPDYSKMSDADLLKLVGPQASTPEPQQTYDAMGNPTGMTAAAPVTAGMSYGDQMANVGRTIDKGVRMAANGATFGLADKFAGGMDALTGRAGSYDEGVKAQRAQTESIREDAPGLALAAEAAGGALTGTGLIKSGLTLAGRMGPTLLGRSLGYGLEGAAYGGAHGTGNTYSDKASDYLENAKTGAATGFGVGAVLPVAGTAAGGAYRAGAAFLGPRVEEAGRGASAMLRAAAQADEAGMRALPQMGSDAMLVDAGPAMLGLGQGAGTGTGEGRSRLVEALINRDKNTGSRLANVLDENLGPASRPSQVEAGLAQARQDLGPQYEAVIANAGPVDTRELAAQLYHIAHVERGPAQRAAQQVRNMLDGPPRLNAAPHARPPLEDDPGVLLNTRQAIDGMLTTEADPNAIRVLTQARNAVDDELARAVPGLKDVDARFAEFSRQSEGLQRGSQVFDTGKTAIRPADLTDELATAAQPQGTMVGPSAGPARVRQGARAEIDRIVGTSVNDLNALERKLGTPQDWNAQKMATVFGDAPTARVAKALLDNRAFRDSYQKIVQNSQTAQRMQSAQAMEGSPGGNVRADATMTGIGLKALNMIAKAISGASSASTKDEIGRVLATQGPDVQRVAQSLLQSAQQTGNYSRAIARVLSSPNWIGASTPAAGRR